MKKYLRAGLMFATLAVMTQTTWANNLNISNASGRYVSFSINKNCRFIIAPHDITPMSDAILRDACKFSPYDCPIFLYDSSGCGGYMIAKVNISVDSGLIGVYVQSGSWNVTGSKFNLQMSGPG